MLADLDLLLTAVFCTADDLLTERKKNARRRLADAEVVTLCVAQSIMGVTSDERFVRVAHRRLRHLFPGLTRRSGLHRRRERLTETIEALIEVFASRSPGYHDDLLLVDSTPVECARSRETVKRGGSSCLADALSDAADYGYCASHSRFFFGFRLHTLMAPDGTPRAMALTLPKEGEREVCLRLLGRVNRSGPVTVLGDKGYAGAAFEADAAEPGATIVRPRRKGRGRRGTPPGPSAPADRVDLLDRQGHPRPRASRRPHPARAAGADRLTLPGARRRGLPEPRTGTEQQGARRPRRLNRGTTHLGKSLVAEV